MESNHRALEMALSNDLTMALILARRSEEPAGVLGGSVLGQKFNSHVDSRAQSQKAKWK